jgi:CelD/BcsL family acetyltransferase involved in cellulose biosynthesis
VAAHTASPLVRVEGLSWEEFLGRRSRKFRRTMRNHERRLARDWGLRYRLADDPARLGDDMDLLDRLHEKRWGGRPGGWRYAQTSRFERELAPLALERGWLRLWIMELEGRPAQALLGFRYGGVEWAHRVGRDPDPRWGTLSIGLVLFGHAIREAIGEGVHTYHFGRGASEFKARFTDEDPGLDQVVLARGPVGRAALQTWRPDSWWLSAISSWRGRRR